MNDFQKSLEISRQGRFLVSLAKKYNLSGISYRICYLSA